MLTSDLPVISTQAPLLGAAGDIFRCTRTTIVPVLFRAPNKEGAP
jgi:hypothetical protein